MFVQAAGRIRPCQRMLAAAAGDPFKELTALGAATPQRSASSSKLKHAGLQRALRTLVVHGAADDRGYNHSRELRLRSCNTEKISL
jgi:hypothetical protein